jgi:uncharacterized damage-inducible protein DinB
MTLGSAGLAARATSPVLSCMAFDLKKSLLSAFATNDRINRYLLENIADEAWDAKPPEGSGRTIGAIAAHIHNVRLMWLKAVGAAKLPAKVKPNATAKHILLAFRESHDALAAVLASALEGGQVKGFKPDVAGFYAYLIAHDAHHRGQISSLARRLGHPIPQSAMFGMWEWGSRAKEIE